ncbi:hypothetical protein [Pseudovibrio exalbescens]|uniref:hypothetical protein n=1 Tax=Pseudovibrio exalbescens TaxID=197461 RepID=UPI000C9A925C|nr:hypothetical protein [Pseudovibrio exalbescens]
MNISDYLTEDQMREIATEEFRRVCASKADEDFERIISNAGYHAVFKLVDEQIDGEFEAKVREKALAVIDSLTAFSVFRAADIYNGSDSPAHRMLMAAVQANADALNKSVRDAIRTMPRHEIHQIIAGGEFTFKTGQ